MIPNQEKSKFDSRDDNIEVYMIADTGKMSSSKKTNNNSNRKRKLPKSFLDSPSLSLVADFPTTHSETNSPPAGIVSTTVVSETTKEVFLDRLVKEIVQPYRPTKRNNMSGEQSQYVLVQGGKLRKQVLSKSTGGTTLESVVKQQGIWSERLRLGTNQCQRILETTIRGDGAADTGNTSQFPILVVLARDIYPPTMLVSVPVMAKRLGLDVLLLPGRASKELGQALGVKKTSILLFLSATSNNPENAKVDSFLEFVSKEMIHAHTSIDKNVNE